MKVFGLVLCLIGLSYYSVAEAADWPQWRGPNRDGKSLETGLAKKWPQGGPKMLWSIEGLGMGFSTVSIADGLLYTTGMIGKEGILFAIDLPDVQDLPAVQGSGQAGSGQAGSGLQQLLRSAAVPSLFPFGGIWV